MGCLIERVGHFSVFAIVQLSAWVIVRRTAAVADSVRSGGDQGQDSFGGTSNQGVHSWLT